MLPNIQRRNNTNCINHFQKIEVKGIIPNSFYEATITQYETQTKRIKSKEIRPISLMNTEVKILNKILPRNPVICKKNMILPLRGLHTKNAGQYLGLNPWNSLY